MSSFRPTVRAAAATLATSLALLVASGCLDWSADVPRYRRVLDTAQPAARPSFDAGGPISLADALRLANADNEAIASRGEDYIQSLADKMRQAGRFLPTLTLAPTYTLSSGSTRSGAGAAVSSVQLVTDSHQFSLPVDVSAVGSLSNVSNFKAAGRTAEQRARQLLDERETILLQVVQSYYTVLKSEREAEVYEQSLKSKAEKVRDQTARLKLGNVRPLDLAQTQADLAATGVSLIQARTDAANARSTLSRLIAVSGVNGPLTDQFEVPTELHTIDQWLQRAQSDRQDLLAASSGLASARSSLEAAIREYFPSVSVNLNYFIYNDPTSVQTWSSAVSASIPIFSALSIEADVRKAWSLYRQAALNERQTKRQVTDDVNESYQSLSGSRARIEQLRVEVEAATRASELAERSYRLGSLSNLDRLTQQDNLLTAELNLTSEQFGEKTYFLTLLRAAGALSSVMEDDGSDRRGLTKEARP